jgi:hypothetical protein
VSAIRAVSPVSALHGSEGTAVLCEAEGGMNAKHWNGDDEREFNAPPDHVEHYPNGECDCHCPKCGKELETSPYSSKVFACCGDCYGGTEPDGEAFRGGERQAWEREQMAEGQKLK